jgi:hypothetical protein
VQPYHWVSYPSLHSEAHPGDFCELPNELVDPDISGAFQHPEDAPVSSDYLHDAQAIMSPNFNAYDDSPYYSTPASGLFDSGDASATTIQTPSIVSFSGNVPPVQVLPQSQPSGSISTITTISTQPSGAPPLTCPLGCRGTFGRPSEYRRHMTKHQGRSFNCTQPGCVKSFHRGDKLRDHLRQAHKIAQPGRAQAPAATALQNVAAPSGSGQM